MSDLLDHLAPATAPARRKRRLRPGAVLGSAALLLTGGLVLAPASVAAADTTGGCGDFDQPIFRAVDPGTDATFLSSSADAVAAAAAQGFTDDQGVAFYAATSPGDGRVAVTQLYRAKPEDYLYTRSASEVTSATDKYHYDEQGATFYAATKDSDCLQAVSRYRKTGQHRLVVSEAEKAALVDDSWIAEGQPFFVAPATGTSTPAPAPAPDPDPAPNPGGSGSTFSFAVEPDTQLEVVSSNDTRMVNRADWLVKQKVAFVAHTGDMVNWDTDDHAQMARAKKAMDVLEQAGIPYTIAIGNHDTEATGVGGSARDPQRTYQLQRDTSTINSYFKASDLGGVSGAYEPGKIDNVYSTYTAGGYKWMVLSLEFCARPGAVAWAKQVVADHPDYNVLVATHSYLDGSGAIDQSNQGYGDTSGQKLFDELVSQYPNIKMVFSGHVGVAEKARVDTGKNGNTIYSFLTTMHDATTNPVRMFDVDTAAGTVSTRIYAPATNKTWGEYSQTLTGVSLVR